MRSYLGGVLTALALISGSGSASAQLQQQYGTINQPAVSPYLNIPRGGAPAAINYYNLVQPQVQFSSAINQLQRQQQQQQTVTSYNTSGELITGHPIQFANLSHFYPPTVPGRGPVTSPVSGQALQNPTQQNAPIRPIGTSPAAFPLRGSPSK